MENFANDDIKKIAAFMLMTLAIANANIALASPMDFNSSLPGFNDPVSAQIRTVEIYAPLPGITPNATPEVPIVAFYGTLPSVEPAVIAEPTSVEIYAPLSNINTMSINADKNTTPNNINQSDDKKVQLLPVNNNSRVKGYGNYGNVQIIDDGRQYIFK